MTYQDTVNWMFSQLPLYQNQGKTAYKKDLSNTILLSNHLKNPEINFKSIHVAGTNGKGSTSHMLASILQESGYKVGLYTSPHLKDFRERIKINGKEISENFVIDFVKQNKSFFEINFLSFFEMTVGLAFDYFSKENVDIAVIEVGLGGRLDSTNIIIPEVSVITNIGIDHTQFLGDTIEAIAFEKAGIIKPNIPVIIGQTQKQTKTMFQKIAEKLHSKIVFADTTVTEIFDCDLKGNYQRKNIKTAIQTIKEIRLKNFNISQRQIEDGLLKVVINTGLKGRWQVLKLNPKIICDTAHNKEGLLEVMHQLLNEAFEQLHIVFGVVDDKSQNSIIGLLPKHAIYYFCKPNIPRGLDAKLLKNNFDEFGLKGYAYSSVKEAYLAACKQSRSTDLIFIGGSTFVVAEII